MRTNEIFALVSVVLILYFAFSAPMAIVEQDAEDSYSCITFHPSFPCTACVDENWDSHGRSNENAGGSSYIYEKTTIIPETVMSWKYKVGSAGTSMIVSCKDNLGRWVDFATGLDGTFTFPIPSSCLGNDSLEVRSWMITDASTGPVKYYEGSVLSYTDPLSCNVVGGFWYDNICNLESNTKQDTGVVFPPALKDEEIIPPVPPAPADKIAASLTPLKESMISIIHSIGNVISGVVEKIIEVLGL